MTEYTTSSEAIRDYLSARQRTAMWVHKYGGHGSDDQMLSPSVPPSIISDSEAPSYGPTDSDVESDHSLPPRMVLRYGDGRPDIPIPTESNQQSRARAYSNPVRRHQDSRGSTVHRHHGLGGNGLVDPAFSQGQPQPRYAQTLSYASGHPLAADIQGNDFAPPSPEHIVILPSPQGEEPPSIPSAHPIPRAATIRSAHPEQIIPTGVAPSHQPSQHTIHAPSPRRAYDPSHSSQHNTDSPAVAYSHSHPPSSNAHGNTRPIPNPNSARPGTTLPYAYSPPQIIYASSSRNTGSHYAPPQIVYSPPSRSHHSHTRGPAPSITYSHSDPLPDHHNNPYYHNVSHPSDRRGGFVEEASSGSDNARSHYRSVSSRGRPRTRIPIERSPPRSRSETPPLSDAGSRTSGSTYYILPTPGQKVQIIPPGAPSLHTATTSTKGSHHSPISPHAPHPPPHHKNIFQKIFSIPRFAGSIDSRASSGSSSRRLHRRHTLGGAHIQPQH
ncbi:hypothetical protein BDY19DRAFT_897814 [Irpex rosettiformis]|uniref:Uncharacterized protein n=1 Tax=Irpex rosettiformis TaxID=378272 RepID=A0ACB8TS08_9APHY|nr:hypothetical protein BDY19DRAFT_897814 [Irpex rosettiformis]